MGPLFAIFGHTSLPEVDWFVPAPWLIGVWSWGQDAIVTGEGKADGL